MDDTDSLHGGCTTEVLFHLIQNLPPNVEVGQARLVRLWPFARQRTRGNAAVAIELKTSNEPSLLEFFDRFWNDTILPLKGRIEASRHNEREQYPSDPGMVWFKEMEPDAHLYRNGLRQVMTIAELPPPAKSWGGHGRIGATLAVCWPAQTSTFEGIAWRLPDSHGNRKLDAKAVELVDNMDSTFLCRDDRLGTSLLAPRGNSPVLFGVRTWTKEAAEEALQLLIRGEQTEPVQGYLVFETNHATNDHLEDSIDIEIKRVEILKGGHTLLHSSTNQYMAFKESGEIASICQQLCQGDVIECMGMQSPDGSVHIEYLRIKHLVDVRARPLCSICNKAMSSMGRNQGLRCKKCGRQIEDSWVTTPRSLPVNRWIQPPASARRHLAKPLDEASNRENNL